MDGCHAKVQAGMIALKDWRLKIVRKMKGLLINIIPALRYTLC